MRGFWKAEGGAASSTVEFEAIVSVRLQIVGKQWLSRGLGRFLEDDSAIWSEVQTNSFLRRRL